MVLYIPSFESVHKLIYQKLQAYGITTFWTNAKATTSSVDPSQYDMSDIESVSQYIADVTASVFGPLPPQMKLIQGSQSATLPDWVYDHWIHTYSHKREGFDKSAE